jgi:uracil-DNA glycosylase
VAYTSLVRRLQASQEAGGIIYPAAIWRALECVAPANVRLVIVGQDPYHQPNQAQGLAFSVGYGQPLPPSLRNILAEVVGSTGGISNTAAIGDLSGWAQQGALLLNTSLTVERDQPGAHADWGWQVLTQALLAHVAALPGRRVFMLWGAHAQSLEAHLHPHVQRHLILRANHPSPLSARRPPMPFIGCNHFQFAIEFMEQAQPGMPQWEW